MKEPLIKQSAQTPKVQESSYFIHRYNTVIEVYNKNRGQSPQLNLLDNNRTFQIISMILTNLLTQILLILILLIVPVVNLVCMGAIWFYFFFIRRQTFKHRQNQSKVANPLKQFCFLPDLCQNIGKHWSILNLDLQDLEGFTFNQNLYKQLKNKLMDESSKKITIIIYDQYFFDSYYIISKENFKIRGWIILSAILISLSILFYVIIFDMLF